MPQNQYRPDTQKEVYYEFFNELDSAVVSLTDYIDKKPDSNGFTRFDILLDGQYPPGQVCQFVAYASGNAYFCG